MRRRRRAISRTTRCPSRPTSARPRGGRLKTTERSEVGVLLSAAAVRERCGVMLEAARAGRLAHFAVADARLGAVADYVADTVRANYPTLKVPFHSRWRHFVVDG